MNRVLSFARLDFVTVKPYFTIKNILIFLLVFGFVGFSTGEPFVMISMFMVYGVVYTSYPFAVGDKNGIDTLYATLPLTKGDIVAGRYVFALCMNIIVSAVAFIGSVILMLVLGRTVNYAETALTILFCFAVYSIIGAIQIPVFFRFGYAKAKFLAYLPLAVIALAAGTLTFVMTNNVLPVMGDIFMWVSGSGVIAAMLAAVIWVLVLLLSGFLSYRAYRKREF